MLMVVCNFLQDKKICMINFVLELQLSSRRMAGNEEYNKLSLNNGNDLILF